jgi:hypothetical protein
MTFKLSQKSLDTLKGVNEKLIATVHDAIKISTVDFSVGEGMRTLERQSLLVKSGKSKTMNSKHITGQAVDLWAYVKNSVSWELKHYYDIAHAMRDSAIKNNVILTWGAVWDKRLNDIKNTEIEPTHYKERRDALGKKTFIDAVHFELLDKKD